MAAERIELPWSLGWVSPMTAGEVCDWILQRRTASAPSILANLNLHAVYLSQTDDAISEFNARASAVIIDGWPVLQLARFVSPGCRLTGRYRVGSTDWLDELLGRDPDISVVTVGGTPRVASSLAAELARRTRRTRWLCFDGFTMEGAGAVRCLQTDLDAALGGADLVLVGMGMPIQEQWALSHLGVVRGGAVVANVGGCFDYYVGEQRLAPRWMGALGTEWLYRLVRSPRRLARRYLWEPLQLVALVMRRQYARRHRKEERT